MKSITSFAAMIVGTLLISADAFAGVAALPVPEPASLGLLAGGVAAVAYIRRRRK